MIAAFVKGSWVSTTQTKNIYDTTATLETIPILLLFCASCSGDSFGDKEKGLYVTFPPKGTIDHNRRTPFPMFTFASLINLLYPAGRRAEQPESGKRMYQLPLHLVFIPSPVSVKAATYY